MTCKSDEYSFFLFIKIPKMNGYEGTFDVLKYHENKI